MTLFAGVAGANESPPPPSDTTRAARLALPDPPFDYTNVKFPRHFAGQVEALDNTPADNPMTDAGVTLGRVLFYDTRLSANATVSCGSCHVQSRGFSDGLATSMGHRGVRTDRNTHGLVNLRFSRAHLFWDERATTVEEAVLIPVHHRFEMGQNSRDLERTLGDDTRYGPLFEAAFGSPEVTEARVGLALAQFLRALVSVDSRYDRAAAKAATFEEDFAGFTPTENLGKRLFETNCVRCHHIGETDHVAFFSMFRSLNNGIDADGEARDGGRGDVTFNPSEVGLFKGASLRNVAVTAPYMHDGRIETLEGVIEHYSTGVLSHPTLGPVSRMQFSDEEKGALVAFLHTLTDESFLNDPRFADPWLHFGGPAAEATIVRAESADEASGDVPASTSRARERAEAVASTLIARGRGFRVGEAAPWLEGLDFDADGALDADELAPVAIVLARTENGMRIGMSREVRRRPARRPGAREEGSRSGGPNAPARPADGTEPGSSDVLGDFDRDGSVSPSERRTLESFERLVRVGDGNRLDVILDRHLAGYDLPSDEQLSLRRILATRKNRLSEAVRSEDTECVRALRAILGEERFGRYQDAVVARSYRGSRRQPDLASREASAMRQILDFDADGDDRLSGSERDALAAGIDSIPGGFGLMPAPHIDREQFTRRLLSYGDPKTETVPVDRIPERMYRLLTTGDLDGNGIFDRSEIDAHIRETAFRRLVDEGIYIGGGFGNTLQETALVLDDFDLEASERAELERVLVEHGRTLDRLGEEATRDLFPALREALNGKFTMAVSRRR